MVLVREALAMHTFRHYRVRLRGSRRLRYRLARRLLPVIPWLLLILVLVYVARARR
jgi:hypothetical protein